MKVYVFLLLEYPEDGDGGYDSAEVVYVTKDKNKMKNIQKLWDIIQKECHVFDSKKMQKALEELKSKYGIICWSGQDLEMEEKELQ